MSERGERIRVVHPLFQEEGGGSSPTSPLQLKVGQIDKSLFMTLNQKWHSRLPECGNVFGGIAFGAEFDGLLYAVAYWSTPISYHHDDGATLELRRMAVSDDAPVNTPTRFLRVMLILLKRAKPNLWRLISYQDPSVHQGTIYRAAGWCDEGERDTPGWSYRTGRPDQAPGNKVRWAKYLSEKPDWVKDKLPPNSKRPEHINARREAAPPTLDLFMGGGAQ